MRINLGEGFELVAEPYYWGGDHPDIVVCIEKDGSIYRSICTVMPCENKVECCVYTDDDCSDVYVIGIREEEE